MKVSKILNSKNLGKKIEFLFLQQREELAKSMIERKEITPFLQNILSVLKRIHNKKEDFAQTKVFSKVSLNKEALRDISLATHINLQNPKTIIDPNMSAGVKIKSGSKLIDATLPTMLEHAFSEK